ncbi:MAG: thiamine pyrophosphate-binding protein [Gammaproteobacteria bacterium]|nr:thiamine pyrophosphate-binding protein [Gammaproteobacteria bacterium]
MPAFNMAASGRLKGTAMRGGQVFMEGLVAHGVDCIFGNPGTTENSLLDRLIDTPQIQYYVTLHEGIAVCAASFYAQASGKTGIVNLHVAPGLGNGIGMMYGALKANSPLIVTAGQQDTRMRMREPLLSHDLVAMAEPVAKWSAEPRSADEIGPMLRRAFKVANEPPRGPVFMSLPVDVMEQETDIGPSTSGDLMYAAIADVAGVAQLANALASSAAPAIVIGDDVATEGASAALVRLAEATGASIWQQGLRTQASFPNSHPNYCGRLPFEAAGIRKALTPHDLILLTGGPFFEEIWFDAAAALPDSAIVIQLESNYQRIALNFSPDLGLIGHLRATLERLLTDIETLGSATLRDAATTRNALLAEQQLNARESARDRLARQGDALPMTPARAIHEMSQVLPERTIVVDETITASLEVSTQFEYNEPGDFFAGAGGGIGQGIAGAVGVQVAQPDRRVLALSGDGSAMYSIQALWTAVHHQLPIVFVILANREYRILKHNLDIYRQRFNAGSNKPYPHMDLTSPTLGFPALAQGMGMAAEAVTNPGEIGPALQRAFAANAPYLIEVEISGKP